MLSPARQAERAPNEHSPEPSPARETRTEAAAKKRSMFAGLEGAARAAQLVAGMERERQAQLDPNVRAERAVATWRKLEQEHGRLHGFEHGEARGQIEARMKALAGAIKCDPQMESVMRARARELVIERGSKLDRVTQEKTSIRRSSPA